MSGTTEIRRIQAIIWCLTLVVWVTVPEIDMIFPRLMVLRSLILLI